MPLRVTVAPIEHERVASGDTVVEATISNAGPAPEPFHRHQPLRPPPPPPGNIVFEVLRETLRHARWYIATIKRLFCLAVLEKEVSVKCIETISDAYPPSWNGSYQWWASFHVQVDQPRKRVVVTIRLRLVGVGTSTAYVWQNTVEAAWGNRFKSCV